MKVERFIEDSFIDICPKPLLASNLLNTAAHVIWDRVSDFRYGVSDFRYGVSDFRYGVSDFRYGVNFS